MKKRILLSTLVLAVAAIGTVILYYSVLNSPVILTTRSPISPYEIRLEEDKSPIHLLLFFSDIKFSAYKNDELMVRSEYLAGYDDFPSRFLTQFPEYGWAEDTVLEFRRKRLEQNDDIDKIFVTNTSGKHVRYLRITAGDMFLVLDIKPNQGFSLEVSHQSGPSWIQAAGMLDDGTPINSVGSNFLHPDDQRRPVRYCVSVTNTGLEIRSPSMEGWNSNKPGTPESPECDKLPVAGQELLYLR